MQLPGATVHEGSTADLDTMAEVLAEAARAFEAHKIDYVLIGGIASSILGRPRCSSDLDLLIAPASAPAALDALADIGFTVERTNPHWLYKAFRREVLIDLLFRASGGIHLDDEMLRRSRVRTFRDASVRVIPPEDLVVMKAIAHDEETPRHWGDALGILPASPLDWDYLLVRARWAPRRVLGFLFYATSVDLHVPRYVLNELSREVLR
jgi:hypothetical protein